MHAQRVTDENFMCPLKMIFIERDNQTAITEIVLRKVIEWNKIKEIFKLKSSFYDYEVLIVKTIQLMRSLLLLLTLP